MSSLAVRLYRVLQPVLGQPLRDLAHALRRRLYRDSSQLGESLVAHHLVAPGDPRWVVEVGANDGVTGSNARFFVRRGWDALLVEPNPRLFPRLAASVRGYPKARCVQAACSDAPGTLPLHVFEGDATGMLSTLGPAEAVRASDGAPPAVAEVHEVAVETLAALLDRHGVPPGFAVLSVDTEGHDLQVLRGLDLGRYHPRVLITETDEATEAEKRALLEAHGYRQADEVGVNTIWRREA